MRASNGQETEEEGGRAEGARMHWGAVDVFEEDDEEVDEEEEEEEEEEAG